MPGDGDDQGDQTSVPPSLWAVLTSLSLVGFAALTSGLTSHNVHHAPLLPGDNATVFAAFYVAAQALERFLEPFSRIYPWKRKSPESKEIKANRALLMLGVGTVVGAVASGFLGLYFLAAVTKSPPTRWLDIFITALLISGGTKPLHDLISRIEKAKEGQ